MLNCLTAEVLELVGRMKGTSIKLGLFSNNLKKGDVSGLIPSGIIELYILLAFHSCLAHSQINFNLFLGTLYICILHVQKIS